MLYLISIILGYITIGIIKMIWLFITKSPSSPYVVRHPSIGSFIGGIFIQPIIKISMYLMNYRRGRENFYQLFVQFLKFLLILVLFSYFIFLLIN